MSCGIKPHRNWNDSIVQDREKDAYRRRSGKGRQGEEPQNKAAAGDANAVSTGRGGRRFYIFAGRQQLAEGAPLSRKPFCVLRSGPNGIQATRA